MGQSAERRRGLRNTRKKPVCAGQTGECKPRQQRMILADQSCRPAGVDSMIVTVAVLQWLSAVHVDEVSGQWMAVRLVNVAALDCGKIDCSAERPIVAAAHQGVKSLASVHVVLPRQHLRQGAKHGERRTVASPKELHPAAGDLPTLSVKQVEILRARAFRTICEGCQGRESVRPATIVAPVASVDANGVLESAKTQMKARQPGARRSHRRLVLLSESAFDALGRSKTRKRPRRRGKRRDKRGQVEQREPAPSPSARRRHGALESSSCRAGGSHEDELNATKKVVQKTNWTLWQIGLGAMKRGCRATVAEVKQGSNNSPH